MIAGMIYFGYVSPNRVHSSVTKLFVDVLNLNETCLVGTANFVFLRIGYMHKLSAYIVGDC